MEQNNSLGIFLPNKNERILKGKKLKTTRILHDKFEKVKLQSGQSLVLYMGLTLDSIKKGIFFLEILSNLKLSFGF
jgi:hypothetical protein